MGGNNRTRQQQEGDLVWLSAEYISRGLEQRQGPQSSTPQTKQGGVTSLVSHRQLSTPDSVLTARGHSIHHHNKQRRRCSGIGRLFFLSSWDFLSTDSTACCYLHRGENTELAAALCYKETQYGRWLHRDHLPACVIPGGVKTLSLPCSTEL